MTLLSIQSSERNPYIVFFFFRNEKTLAGVERKHGIRVRWQENDSTFASVQQRLTHKKQNNELLSLQKMASERTFLLELKAKYAGLNIFNIFKLKLQ